jgi:outer membrane protein assembly factor BamB
MKLFHFLPATSAFLHLGILLAIAEDWPQWRGPFRNGTTSETNWSHTWPGGEPKKIWTAEAGIGVSSIVVAQSNAYTLGHRGGSNVVGCFDTSDGALRWQYAYAEELMDWQFEGGPCSTPLVEGGRIYAAGRSSNVQCLDAQTGKLIWSQNLKKLTGLKPGNWGLNGSPLLSQGRLILNFGTVGMALDPADGKQLWLSGPKENTYTSPIYGEFDGKPALFVAGNDQLAFVEPSDGTTRWTTKFKVGFKAGDPVSVPGGVFFSSLETGGAMVRIEEGKEPKLAWRKSELGAITGTPVFIDGYLYGVLGDNSGKGALSCVKPETGEVRWSRPGFGWGSLLAAGDRLLVLSDRGALSVVKADPNKCNVLASGQVIGGKVWTAPSLSNGKLYIRNIKGRVVVYDLGKR